MRGSSDDSLDSIDGGGSRGDYWGHPRRSVSVPLQRLPHTIMPRKVVEKQFEQGLLNDINFPSSESSQRNEKNFAKGKVRLDNRDASEEECVSQMLEIEASNQGFRYKDDDQSMSQKIQSLAEFQDGKAVPGDSNLAESDERKDTMSQEHYEGTNSGDVNLETSEFLESTGGEADIDQGASLELEPVNLSRDRNAERFDIKPRIAKRRVTDLTGSKGPTMDLDAKSLALIPSSVLKRVGEKSMGASISGETAKLQGGPQVIEHNRYIDELSENSVMCGLCGLHHRTNCPCMLRPAPTA